MAFSGDGASDHRTTTVAIVLGVLGAIAVAAILWYIARMKPSPQGVGLPSPSTAKGGYAFTGFGSKGQQEEMKAAGGKGGKHIRAASKITPFAFGANGDGPVFDHEPGTNMRIATRRSNGVWAFHELDPHSGSPLGVSDPSPSPSPISPFNSASSPPTPSSSVKGHSAKTPSSGAASTFTFEPHGYAAHSINQRKKSIGNYLEFGPTSLRTSPSTTTLNTSFTHSTANTMGMGGVMTPTLPSPAYGPDSPVIAVGGGGHSPTSPSMQRPTTPLAPAPPNARTFTR